MVNLYTGWRGNDASNSEFQRWYFSDVVSKSPTRIILKLTQQLKIGLSQRKVASQPSIVRAYVSFKEGNFPENQELFNFPPGYPPEDKQQKRSKVTGPQ